MRKPNQEIACATPDVIIILRWTSDPGSSPQITSPTESMYMCARDPCWYPFSWKGHRCDPSRFRNGCTSFINKGVFVGSHHQDDSGWSCFAEHCSYFYGTDKVPTLDGSWRDLVQVTQGLPEPPRVWGSLSCHLCREELIFNNTISTKMTWKEQSGIEFWPTQLSG